MLYYEQKYSDPAASWTDKRCEISLDQRRAVITLNKDVYSCSVWQMIFGNEVLVLHLNFIFVVGLVRVIYYSIMASESENPRPLA